MTTERPASRRRALAEQSLARSAHLAAEPTGQRGLAPSPGDLFLLPAAAGLPVEWVVLARRPGAAGEVLVVPADTCPLVGSADVEVPAGVPGGPLSLRCGFGAWLPAAAFEAALRTSVLAEEAVAEGLAHWRRVEAGKAAGSPLAEEVDVDPEYQDWTRDVLRPAHALATSPPRATSRPSGRRFGGAYKLAAALVLVNLGLSSWILQLRREVERLSAPRFGLPYHEIAIGENTRGPSGTKALEVRRGASDVVLMLVVGSSWPPGEGRFEIARKSDEIVWRSDPLLLRSGDDFMLVLPRELLPDGEYRVRIVPEGGAEPVLEEVLLIEAEE